MYKIYYGKNKEIIIEEKNEEGNSVITLKNSTDIDTLMTILDTINKNG